MLRAGLVTLALAALAQAAPVVEPTKTVEQRQFSWGDPGTWFGGGGSPAPTTTILPPITGGIIPSGKRQEDTIGIGGSTPDETQAKIIALELEYEKLVQAFGKPAPWYIQKYLDDIEAKLLEYGITIVESPDGTSSTFVPGKRDVSSDPIFIIGHPITGPIIPDPKVPGGPLKPSD
ncbi:hypothetical protein F4778DRAFT_220459 [Xylariomycetidae sp. FL2044]|nr:hypothetical protein F4778DRAFT_220459 [Xylariomycetidae sp. FL2044]